MSAKTLPPTPERLRRAKEEGDLLRSRLLTTGLGWLAIVGVLGATVYGGAGLLMRFAQRVWSIETASESTAMANAGAVALSLSAPTWAVVTLACVVMACLVQGACWTPSLLKPKWERISMAQGARRMFTAERLLELGKSFAISIAAGVWLLWVARALLPLVPRVVAMDGQSAFVVLLDAMRKPIWGAVLGVLFLGLCELGLARWQRLRRLRMSHQEYKEEHKQNEGDPHVKGRRRAEHREILSGGPARGVAAAHAIVVNPTHIAVALRYAPDECDAPYIVAKGREDEALQIRLEAAKHKIPIVRNIPLARSLVQLELGHEVPEELYVAAASVLKAAGTAHAEATAHELPF